MATDKKKLESVLRCDAKSDKIIQLLEEQKTDLVRTLKEKEEKLNDALLTIEHQKTVINDANKTIVEQQELIAGNRKSSDKCWKCAQGDQSATSSTGLSEKLTRQRSASVGEGEPYKMPVHLYWDGAYYEDTAETP